MYIALGVAGGGVLSCAAHWYKHYLNDLLARHEWAQANHLVNLTIRGVAVTFLVLAVTFWLPAAIYGGRILLARRWPLSEARASAAGKVLHGPRAVLFGLLILVLSLSSGGVALCAGVAFWHGQT
jgi:hypothetical protein